MKRLMLALVGVALFSCAGGVSPSNDGGGSTSPGLFLVSSGRLDFGQTRCGATASARDVVISNPGSTSYRFAATLGRGPASPFTLSATNGEVPAQGAVTLTLTPKAVASRESTAENALGDVLTISSDLSGSTPALVQLLQTARGADVRFSTNALDFGSVGIDSAQTSLIVQNVGTASAIVTLNATGDGFSVPPEPVVVGAGEAVTTFVTFAPTSTSRVTGSVKATLSGAEPSCGEPPTNVSLSGQGSQAAVAVTPVSIAFGDNGFVDCGAVGGSKSVQVRNDSDSTITFSASLARAALSSFVLSASAGQVAPHASANLEIVPKQIPTTASVAANAFGDVLVITTNARGDAAHRVDLQLTARGAVITRSATSFAFGNVALNQAVSGSVTLSNTGNAPARVDHLVGLSVFDVPSGVLVPAGQTVQLPLRFQPTQSQTYIDAPPAVLQPAVDGGTLARCAAAPTPLTLTGTGTTPSLSVFPNSLNFGFTQCGGPAGAAQIVNVRNNGPTTTFTASLLKGVGANFTVTPESGTVQAQGSIAFTVTPTALPSVAPTSANFFGDNLMVQTDNGTVLVALSLTALGAIFEFRNPVGSGQITTLSTGTVGVADGGVSDTLFTVFNSGNMPARNVSVTLGGSNPQDFTVDAGFALISNSGYGQGVVRFRPTATGARAATLSVSSTTPTCGVTLPVVALPVSGTGQ